MRKWKTSSIDSRKNVSRLAREAHRITRRVAPALPENNTGAVKSNSGLPATLLEVIVLSKPEKAIIPKAYEPN